MTKNAMWKSMVAAGALLFASTAVAQEETLTERIAQGQVAGGLGFYSGTMATLTAPGPAWGARIAMEQEDMFIRPEFNYVGSRNPIEDEFFTGGDTGAIWRNGVTALGKVGPTLGDDWKPYVGVGIGGSFLHPTQDATPNFRDDFVLEIPFTAGVNYELEQVIAGVRADWSPLVGLEVADPTGLDNPNGGLFTTTLSVGGEF